MEIPRYPELFEFVAIEWIFNYYVEDSSYIVAVQNCDSCVFRDANGYFVVPGVPVARRLSKKDYGAFT